MSGVRRALCVDKFSVYTLEVTVLAQTSSNLLSKIVLIISRISKIMGWIGSKSRSLGQILEEYCYTLGATCFIQFSSNLLRMFLLIISRCSTIFHGRGLGDLTPRKRSIKWWLLVHFRIYFSPFFHH